MRFWAANGWICFEYINQDSGKVFRFDFDPIQLFESVKGMVSIADKYPQSPATVDMDGPKSQDVTIDITDGWVRMKYFHSTADCDNWIFFWDIEAVLKSLVVIAMGQSKI
jgi:hypothetical protein